MSITLFGSRNFEGDRHVVRANVVDLGTTNVRHGASSMRMTSGADKVLCFKRKDYAGDVMFRRGVQDITALGLPGQGGRIGFGDLISSVRITPFKVKVFTHIIVSEEGQNPGGLTDAQAIAFARGAAARAGQIWGKGLLNLDFGDHEFRRANQFYNMNGDFLALLVSKFLGGWNVKEHLNVYFVNDFRNKLGISTSPCFGDVVVYQFQNTPTANDGLQNAGCTLAHETGHYLGIHHGSGNGANENLMTPLPDIQPPPPAAYWTTRNNLIVDQIQEVHNTLSKNISRNDLRIF